MYAPETLVMSPAYLRVLVRLASVLLALKRGEAYLLHAWLRELEESLHTYMHTYLMGRDDRGMGILKGEVDKNRLSKHHRMQHFTGHALVLPLIMCALMSSTARKQVSQLQFLEECATGCTDGDVSNHLASLPPPCGLLP